MTTGDVFSNKQYVVPQQYSYNASNSKNISAALKCFADRNLKITASPAAIAALDELGITFTSRPGSNRVEIGYPDNINKTDIFNATNSIDCSRYSSLEVTEDNGRVSLRFSGNDGTRTMSFRALSPDEMQLQNQRELEDSTGYTRVALSMRDRGINITNDVLETMQNLGLEFDMQGNDFVIKPRSGYLIQCNEDNTGWLTGTADQVYIASGLSKVEVTSDGYIKINVQDEQGSYTAILSAQKRPNMR